MNERDGTKHTDRADWLRVLALADADALQRVSAPIVADYGFEILRPAQEGLVMVRARIGNTGDRYNVGEATLTRCTVRHRAPDGRAHVGVGHVMGRDNARAECIARMDALLQREDLAPLLQREVVAPLRALRALHVRHEREATEATRVRFYTLQPETT